MRRVLACLIGALAVYGCSGLSALEQSGDDTTNAPMSQESVANACAEQIASCGVQEKNCVADPTCGSWLSCVKKCPATSQQCIDSCGAGRTASVALTSMQGCLLAGNVCKAKSSTVGNGGDGGTDMADGPTFADGGSGPEPSCYAVPVDPNAGRWDGCTGCYWNECATSFSDLGSRLHFVKVVLEKCAEYHTEVEFEACLFREFEQSGDQADGYQALISTDGLSCLYERCRTSCLPKDMGDTMACLQDQCSEQFDAFATNEAAPKFAWCWAECATTHVDAGAAALSDCKQQCRTTFEEGVEEGVQLASCRDAKCSNICSEQ